MNSFFTAVYRHRHQSDHECEKLDTPQPRMAATQQLVKHIIGKYNGYYILVFFRSLETSCKDLALTKRRESMTALCFNNPKFPCQHVIVFVETHTKQQ